MNGSTNPGERWDGEVALRQLEVPEPPVRLVTGRHVTVIDDGVVEDVAATCGLTGAGLYMMLERRVNRDGEWVSTIGDLATAFGCSQRHLRDTCKTLEDAGFIVREQVTGPRGMTVAIRFILPKHMRTYRAEPTPDATPEPTPEPSRAAVLESSNQVVTSNGVPPVVPQANPKKALPENGPAQQIVSAYCRVAGIETPASYKQAVGIASSLAKAGVQPDQVADLYAFVVDWAGSADLPLMLRQVDRWRSSKTAQPRAPNQPSPMTRNGKRGYTASELAEMARNGGISGPNRDDEAFVDTQFRVVR